MDTELQLNTRNIEHKVTLGYTQGECTDFGLNSHLFFYSFCYVYLWCLWGHYPKQLPILLLFLFHISRLQSHYPAVTPKCLISTGVIWSIGVKCLIRTGNMVISSCHLKTTNGLKNAPEAISEGLKFKNFPGGHASTHLYFCQFVVLWAILFPPALQL